MTREQIIKEQRKAIGRMKQSVDDWDDHVARGYTHLEAQDIKRVDKNLVRMREVLTLR